MGGPTPPAGKHVPHRHVHYFLSGALAGTLSRTFIAPYDRVRLLLQLGQAKGFWSAFQSIYVNDGLMGYFRGNGINCVRAFGSKGLLFGFNDSFKVPLLPPLPPRSNECLVQQTLPFRPYFVGP